MKEGKHITAPKGEPVRVRLFGMLELENSFGRVEETRGRQPLSFLLLKYLLIEPGRPVSAEEVYDRVWPGERGEDARTGRVRLRRIREALEPMALGGIRGLILYRGGMYELNRDYPLEVDAERCGQVLDLLADMPPEREEGLALCGEALELLRGPYMAYTDPAVAPWVTPHRELYQRSFARLAPDALERMLTQERYELLTLLCGRAAEMLPEEEGLHRELIHTLVRQGRERELVRHITRLDRSGRAGWLRKE